MNGHAASSDALVKRRNAKIPNVVDRYLHNSQDWFGAAQEVCYKKYRVVPRLRGMPLLDMVGFTIAIKAAKGHLFAPQRRAAAARGWLALDQNPAARFRQYPSGRWEPAAE